jgi:hypothetical protein
MWQIRRSNPSPRRSSSATQVSTSRSSIFLRSFKIFSLGMTNANMKLVVVTVLLEDKLETPVPHLDDGEHIVTRVVELDKLDAELKGMSRHSIHSNRTFTMIDSSRIRQEGAHTGQGRRGPLLTQHPGFYSGCKTL